MDSQIVLNKLWENQFEELLADEKLRLENLHIVDLIETDGSAMYVPSYMKYFKKPAHDKYPLDLNKGFRGFIWRKGYVVQLSFVETYLLKPNSFVEPPGPGQPAKMKICSHRSLLMRIMRSPYVMRKHSYSNFSFVASKFGNYCFLALNESYSHIASDGRNASYAFKLKQFIFSDTFDGEPSSDAPVNKNELFCVYRAQLGDFDLLYSGEMDGIMADGPLKDLTNMEELNKCRMVRSKLLRQPWQWNWKTPEVWSQAYLSKSDMLIAVNDSEGFVNKPIEYVTLEEFGRSKIWNSNVCIGLLNKILQRIMEVMAPVDCPHTVYFFTFSSVDGYFRYTVHEGRNEYSFLSNELIEKISGLKTC